MHISASRATSYKIHLRDFSLDSSFKCRLEMYLWSNLFNGQISVSKTTSPTSPFYFCIRLFSTVHLLLFSASCNDFTEQSCSTLPFPTFTRTEVLQHLTSSKPALLNSDPVGVRESRLHPSKQGVCREEGTHRRAPHWGDFSSRCLLAQSNTNTSLQSSHEQPPSHNHLLFLTIPNISILSSQRQHLKGRVPLIKWSKSCLQKGIKGNKYLALLILVVFAAPRSWLTSAQLRWPQSCSCAVLPQFITSEKQNQILNLSVRPFPKWLKKEKPKKNKAQRQIWILSFFHLPSAVTAFRRLGPKHYEALLNLSLHMSNSTTQRTGPKQYPLT